ncbi:uncharacterized protein LOC131309831 isoform X2 [Rhododendron vialii]|uniref:uncharacterized protein LOC131309831 isoform X2 n=1 Tax=Rhododendron vialii TaxID=182163 RepID=UPI002660318F|nr:uncharacterized protein LOC131309831 isoform X2 [Rhododendron vialii]
MSRIWASESGWYAIQYPHKTHLSATDEEIDKPPPWKMAFLPLSLTLSIPSISPPPFTAAVSLPSLRALRRSTAIFTRSRRPPGVVCAIPWDFSFLRKMQEVYPVFFWTELKFVSQLHAIICLYLLFAP